MEDAVESGDVVETWRLETGEEKNENAQRTKAEYQIIEIRARVLCVV